MNPMLNNTLPRFSSEVESILRKAGWFPGRHIKESFLESWYAIRHFETTVVSPQIARRFKRLGFECISIFFCAFIIRDSVQDEIVL
jgi:hypothetical protein